MNTVPNVRDNDDRRVDLEQVGAVDVAELGGHEAVHEPRQAEDLGRVLDADVDPGAAQDQSPSAGRAAGSRVEHDEGGEQQQLVRAGDARDDLRRTSIVEEQRDASTSSTSGMAIERIVRGWRRRRAERHLVRVTSPSPGGGPAIGRGRRPARRAGGSRAVRRGAARSSVTGGSLMRRDPRCPAPPAVTRRLPGRG